MIGTLVGGIGLFLLGMILMTDGLKAAAGNALRVVLTRLTGGPFKALTSGVTVTALVQSSSATTLTTIGFVSAGLLTFPQAVGVIFGANLGTTSTGWLVSIIGFKLDIGTLALPLVGTGAMARLLLHGRGAAIGLALAGFGLLFVGIDMLQAGMSGLAERFDPASLPGASGGSRLLLVVVGVVMTVVMQSSSAAMATTLTALHGGTIGLEQGAALVIGQNLGTTVTAGIGAIGATVPAKRTAVAHIAFNVVAAVVAFAILPVMLRASDWIDGEAGGTAVTLAAFHTLFNVLGVLLLLPFVDRFSKAIIRAVPDRGPALTRHLDPSLASLVPVAIEAATRMVREGLALVASATIDTIDGRTNGARHHEARIEAVHQAVGEVRRFLGRVHTSPDAAADHLRHLAALHATDHLDRLVAVLRAHPADALGMAPGLRSGVVELRRACVLAHGWLTAGDAPPVDDLGRIASALATLRETHRQQLLERTAVGLESPEAGVRQLDDARWMETMAYHLWRASHHLSRRAAATDVATDVAVEPPADR